QGRADLDAIAQYLTYGYVPSPASAFQGIRRLPPGHWAKLTGSRLHIERYWSLRYTPKRTVDDQTAADELESLLTEATRLRLIADVPLGVLLSGGLDSSAVVAIMRRLTGGT